MTDLVKEGSRLITEEDLQKFLREARWPRHEGYTYQRIGEILGVSDEVVRLVLTGKRKPSDAFLKKVGFEKFTFYRLKMKPFKRTRS